MGAVMTNAEHDRRIDYIEFSVKSVPDAKRFYGSAFGWTFEDYGPDYASFSDGRLSGGFQTAAKVQHRWPAGHHLCSRSRGHGAEGEAGGRKDRSPDLQLSRRPPVSLHRSERPRAGGVVGYRNGVSGKQ